MSRVFLVEPGLISEVGHYFNYLTAIQNELQKRDIETIIIGSRNADKSLETINNYRPLFNHYRLRAKTYIGKALLPFVTGYRFYKELINIFHSSGSIELKENDVLFMDTILNFQSIGWGLFGFKMRKKLRRLNIKLIFLMRFRFIRPNRFYTIIDKFINIIVYKCLLNNIQHLTVIVTDSTSLKEEYEKLLKIIINVLPIPIRCNIQNEEVAENNVITVTYIGRAFYDKGFDLFIEAVKDMYDKVRMKCRFLIQASQNSSDNHPKTIQALNLLKQMLPAVNIEIISDKISSDGYVDILKKTDIFVIPYRADCHYKSCTSNTFVEAICYNKVPIVHRQTWAGRELLRLGLADLTFNETENISLKKKMLEVIERYEDFQNQISTVNECWSSYHNPEMFTDELLRICSV